MADFRKLSAVEKVESAKDSATVLIEEDGVIKRIPKDEVGGVKENQIYGFDMVFHITQTGNTRNDYATLIYGDTNKVLNKLNNKLPVLTVVTIARWDLEQETYLAHWWHDISESGAYFTESGYRIDIGPDNYFECRFVD